MLRVWSCSLHASIVAVHNGCCITLPTVITTYMHDKTLSRSILGYQWDLYLSVPSTMQIRSTQTLLFASVETAHQGQPRANRRDISEQTNK